MLHLRSIPLPAHSNTYISALILPLHTAFNVYSAHKLNASWTQAADGEANRGETDISRITANVQMVTAMRKVSILSLGVGADGNDSRWVRAEPFLPQNLISLHNHGEHHRVKQLGRCDACGKVLITKHFELDVNADAAHSRVERICAYDRQRSQGEKVPSGRGLSVFGDGHLRFNTECSKEEAEGLSSSMVGTVDYRYRARGLVDWWSTDVIMFECSVGDPSFYAEGMAIGRNKRWRGHSGQSEANEVQCSCRGICRGLRVMILDKEFKGAVAAYASLRSSRHKEKRVVCVCVRANI